MKMKPPMRMMSRRMRRTRRILHPSLREKTS